MNNAQFNFKEEDSKKLKKLIIFSILLCIVFMPIFIKLLSLDSSSKENFLYSLRNFLFSISPYAPIILSSIAIIFSEFIYKSSKKDFYSIKNSFEDEDLYELKVSKIETKLNLLILISNLIYTLSYVFFGIWVSIGYLINPNMIIKVDGVEITLTKAIISLLGFILATIYLILTHRRTINLKKEINPLLKGSIYDINFDKKFLESSDEALKLVIYKSAYTSHRTINITCQILFIIFIILNYIFNLGMLPILIIGFILILQNLSYYITYIKNYK